MIRPLSECSLRYRLKPPLRSARNSRRCALSQPGAPDPTTTTGYFLRRPRIDSLQSGRLEWSRVPRRHHHGVSRSGRRNATVGHRDYLPGGPRLRHQFRIGLRSRQIEFQYPASEHWQHLPLQILVQPVPAAAARQRQDSETQRLLHHGLRPGVGHRDTLGQVDVVDQDVCGRLHESVAIGLGRVGRRGGLAGVEHIEAGDGFLALGDQ